MYISNTTLQPPQDGLSPKQSKLIGTINWTHTHDYHITYHYFSLYINVSLEIVILFLAKSNNINK